MKARSVAEVNEHELVEMLYENIDQFSDLAVPPLPPGPITHRLRVTPEKIGLPSDAFGDIDSLLLSSNDATSARAIEYKRIKVTPHTFRTGRPNKLSELVKAKNQANAVAHAGLSCVWIQVIVVTDAREITGGEFKLVPDVFEVRDQIKAAIPFEHLHPAVGVCVMHLVQPVDQSVIDNGQFGGGMMREPKPQIQSASLTAAIARLFT